MLISLRKSLTEEKDRNRDRDITRGKDLALHVRTRNKY